MQRISPHEYSPAGPGSIRVPAYDKAAEAAIERKLAQYVPLVCGHLTTWEADELYSVFRPDNRSHFCEICRRWKHRKPNPKYVIPDDILF